MTSPSETTESDRPVSVLLLCTANRCRSPLAGEMLRAALEMRQVPAEVETAGFGSGGQLATTHTKTVAASRGFDLEGHRSRSLRDATKDADLIIGMERVHVRDSVVADPASWGHSFTLKELVRRAEDVGARLDDESLEAWLARLHDGRQSQDLLGTSAEDDVADPAGGTLVEHEETADELADLIRRFVDMAWPVRPGISWMAP